MLQILLRVSQILVSLILFGGLVLIGVRARPKEMVLRAYENICMQAKNTSKDIFDYEQWERYLVMHGAAYYYGSWVNPVSYLALCIVLGMLGLAIGISFDFMIAILATVAGIFLPGILLRYLNKRENERMLSQLDLVYSALSIQIRAGVYITDALAECYGSITHLRLRDALQSLSGEIVMNADLDKALEQFQGQFNNRYIDSLCITLLQAMESGQAVDLLGDIAEQIKDMEITLQQKRKEQLNRSATFYQLAIFALILVVVLYACVMHLFSASLFFE